MAEQTKAAPPPAAYVLVAIGGGVVGQDYAQWAEVNPLVGALIGGVISLVLTGWLYYMASDPEGKIKEACSAIGALVGIFWGAYLGAQNSQSEVGWLVGGVVGAVVGGVVGQMAAAFIAFSALLLLFLSQGPVGLVLRTWITGFND